jgi:hypothetical protein
VKDIVVSLEAPEEGATYEYAVLGAYLLRIIRVSDQVQLYRSGQWLRFGLTGADVREHNDATFLTAPALSLLARDRAHSRARSTAT